MFQLPFLKKEQLTNDTFSFYFDRTKFTFDYLPGQYIRMILPHENPDDRGTSRFFTLASSPLLQDHIMITTRIVQSSFKKTLASLSPGQVIQFWGPTGKFVLPEDSQKPLVFLAGGIGLTPYHSMITYAAEKGLQIPMTLLVSFTIPDEIVFKEEFKNITEQHPHIKVIYTITKPEQSSISWEGEKGRISEDLLKRYGGDLLQSTFFVSGPGSMVDGTDTLLKSLHISEENIILEKFPGY